MTATSALENVVQRGLRRHLWNLAFQHSARGGALLAGGFLLLLILGSEVLDWRWIAALGVVGTLAGLRGLRRSIPSRYRVAQGIDRRLGLSDTLSTAVFFGTRTGADEIRTAQREAAERAAAGVDLSAAVPLAAPRSLYVMAALALAACGLFALRYGISRTLDLRAPLTSLVFDVFPFHAPASEERKKAEQRAARDRLKPFGLPLEGASVGEDGQPDPNGAPAETPAAADESERAGSDGSKRGNARAEGASRQGDAAHAPQSASASTPEQDSDGQTSGQSDSKNQQAGKPPEGAQEHANNSLVEKFREAMANLMSRLKSRPGQGEGQQSASSQRADGRQSGEQSKKGAQPSGRKADGSPDAQSNGDEQDASAEPGKNGQAKPGGREGQQAQAKGQSGIGKSDGSKDTREAEQMAAMGKISEIIGKRSQNLTGEMSVEVASSKQQLRTAYSRQAGKHSDAGGEIHRDEIPLAYERYVQQYFEQVRKSAPRSTQNQ